MFAQTKWPPPYEFSDRVCGCEKPWAHKDHPTNENAIACAKCNKYFRYVVFKCSVCNEYYLQTYSHANRCLLDSRCPEHLRAEPCEHEDCRILFDGRETIVRGVDTVKLELPSLDNLALDVDIISF